MLNPLVQKLERRLVLSNTDNMILKRVSAKGRMVGPRVDLISEGDVPDHRDEEGVDCATLQAAVRKAKKLLPEVAADEVPKDGERQAITVLVTDEDGRAVYMAALTYTGAWLIR